MSLLKELLEEQTEQIDALPLLEALEESIVQMGLQKAGGIVKGAADFVKHNPGLAVGAAALAVHAFGQYQKNKRNMIRLHGKSSYEKEMMNDIVKKITADGKWKLNKVKFEGGGKTWELKRMWG